MKFLDVAILSAFLGLLVSGCTIHHSKQALWTGSAPPEAGTDRFVTEEDSGLSLFGVIEVSEPDHFAVLLERARRQNRCERLHQAQLDFYTDHWLIVAFPISRITVLCEEPKRAAR